MAGSSLLALIDDIATILDDVAVLTKVATKKTAGVLGDDLALNAQQVSGVRADRELPVVWAVAKGSALNKLILVPIALAISAVAPWAVVPLLMFGGTFLCYEGAEKLLHAFAHRRGDDQAHHDALLAAVSDPAIDLVKLERTKIKGAIRTDFVLSAEIVAITLGSVAASPFGTRVAVLTLISALMTVGVYGLVAGIVRLDDVGLRLARGNGAARAMGRAILAGAPLLMKFLSVAGTAAMFLVGGGILTHGIPPLHHAIERLDAAASAATGLGAGGALAGAIANGVAGAIAGLLAVGVMAAVVRLRRPAPPTA